MPHGASDRLRLSAAARQWWSVISGGRFLSVSTIAGSGVVAVLLMSPIADRVGLVEHLAAMSASFLAWLIIALPLIPAAFLERKLTSRAARGALIITALLIVTVARPFLNDGIAHTLFGFDSTGQWEQRVATNGVVWFTLLPLIAAATTWYADARESAARLAAALAVFDDLRARVERYAQANATLLRETVTSLRGRRDRLLDAPIDFDAVRAFADDVRAGSHLLDERLQTPLDQRSGYILPASHAPRSVPVLALLARPPAAIIAAVYVAASAPYTFVVGGRGLVLATLAIVAVLALGADLMTRLWARGRSPVAQGWIIVVCWVGVGALVMTSGAVLTAVSGAILLVPLLSIPGVAVIVALGAGALERTRRDSATLTQLLGDTSAIVAAQTARAREPLWRAVDLLHDRVQGRCVIFAARADEREVTAAEIAGFRAETDAAFGEILDGAPERPSAADDLDGLLATWSEVLDVRAEIDAPAVVALQSPPVAAAVVSVVSEGFVNAVKHSSARAARLSVATAPDEKSVTVSVTSPGVLGSTRSTGLGLAGLQDRATLRQVGDEVVLEVTLPTVPIVPAARASSASRRAYPATQPLRLPQKPR